MQYTRKLLMALGLLGGLMLTSCHKDVFNEDDYNKILDEASPVDSVDAKHTWELAQDHIYVVEANVHIGVKSVQILSDNPLTALNAEVIGQSAIEDGGRVMVAATVPTRFNELYAALVDANGLYTVVSFPVESTVVNFSNVRATNKQQSLKARLVQQKLVYCFEEEMPEPGDYDYNDVVLRVSMERSDGQEVRFNIELAAVGGTKQMGAAIRLAGYKYNEVESVKTVDDASFDITGAGELPDMYRTMIQDKSLMQQSMNGEAVLNLFADAHWATGDRIISDNGSITRKRYNVSYEKSDEYGTFYPRELTYIVTFKNGVDVSSLTLDVLDAFIIEEYNGNKYEVHTHKYSKAQVLWPNPSSDAHNLPWAFCVPYESFRWPLHAVAIGYQSTSKSFTYGAYPYLGRSFGEWAADRTKCLNWYMYPDKYEVYE